MIFVFRIQIRILAFLLIGPGTAWAAVSDRVALVVGNSTYEASPDLPNAVNDAQAIARTLDDVGFTVTHLENMQSGEFWQKLKIFRDSAEHAAVALFYYAGHGFQLSGQNYLVPVDARLTDRAAIDAENWRLDEIITVLMDRDKRRQTLIFLDACRDNPLPKSLRGNSGDGLAEIERGTATYVAFATTPGAVTRDGTGDHGPFAEALIKHIPTKGLSISDVMIRVRNDVQNATADTQTPWEQSNLSDQVYFRPEVEKGASLDDQIKVVISKLPKEMREEMLRRFDKSSAARNLKNVQAFVEAVSQIEEVADPAVIAEPVAPGTIEEQTPADVSAPDTAMASSATPTAPQAIGGTLAEVSNATRPEAVTPSAETLRKLADAGLNSASETPQSASQPVSPQQQSAAASPAPRAESITAEARQVASRVARLPSAAEVVDIATPEDSIIGQEIITEARATPADADTSPSKPSRRQEDDLLSTLPKPEILQNFENRVAPENLARAMQTELRRLGCYRQGIDGQWGPYSRKALLRFFAEKKRIPLSFDAVAENYFQLVDEELVVCKNVIVTPKYQKAVEIVKAETKKRVPASRSLTNNNEAPAAKKKRKLRLNMGVGGVR